MTTPMEPPGHGDSRPGRSAIQPRFEPLIQRCRKVLFNYLARHLDEAFSALDDALFEQAREAQSNQQQSLYLDGMRDLRTRKATLERSYFQDVARRFDSFFQWTATAAVPSEGMVKQEDTPLSLLDNQVHEERLLAETMANRARQENYPALHALTQRLAVLGDGSKPDEQANPFAPSGIVAPLPPLWSGSDLSMAIRSVFYKAFDQKVMRSLPTLYASLEKELVDAGVLPNLRLTTIARAPSSTARPASSPEQTARPPVPGSPPSGVDGTHSAASSAGLVSTTQRLVEEVGELLQAFRSSWRDDRLPGGSRSMAALGPDTASQTYSLGALLQALDGLQQSDARDLAKNSWLLRSDALKAQIQKSLKSRTQDPAPTRVADREANTIDLVGMLFDFMLDEQRLPHAFKTQLSRLQVPYLKIALTDASLFSRSTHPARRLLNDLAQAALQLGDTPHNERALQDKIDGIVDQLHKPDGGRDESVEALITDFGRFNASLESKAQLREQRAIEAAKGQDRLLQARRRAQAEIHEIHGERRLPTLVRNFLQLSWLDVLVFIHLRHGHASPAWDRARDVAHWLVWSCTPQDEKAREQLAQGRSGFLDEVRKGLELLGSYPEAGIRKLQQDLVACQHAVQAGQPQLAERLQGAPQWQALQSLPADESNERPAVTASSHSPEVTRRIAELEALDFGCRFEFLQDGSWKPLKLSWYSPQTGRYMFIDQSGQRVAMRQIEQLAEEMAGGTARLAPLTETSPLVDRALGTIHRVLRRVTGRTP